MRFTIKQKLNQRRKQHVRAGFSILELMVSSALLAVIATLSAGAVVTVIAVNQKARAFETIMGNLNYALDLMAREIRMGSKYDCGGGGAPFDCPSSGSSAIVFEGADTVPVAYSLNSGQLYRNGVPLTSDKILIENFTVYVLGSDPSDSLQPKVLIILRGVTSPSARTTTRFDIQTTVTQRLFDQSI
jgi:prepilin-type N-terminal cleavage/methylation domain-containing protein